MTYANLRPTACAVLLLIGISSASALTLESSRGSIVLGRPLDFNVQAILSAGESAASLCLEADVFQGDAAINPGRVNAQLLKIGVNGSSTLRVSSSVIVEEPVVTVVIRYGCLSKNSRRYVVFADPPANVNESVSASGGTSAFVAAPVARAAPTPVSSRIAVVPVLKKQPTAMAPRALVASRRLAEPAPDKATKPRLQLDGIEFGVTEPLARLKSTPELLVLPSELPSAQRLEAAALWRVISAQSDELRQDIQRLTTLQAEAIALREASNKSRAEISSLSTQLKDAQDSKYQNPLVYGLMAMLALIIAGVSGLRFGPSRDNTKTAWWKPRREVHEQGNLQSSEALKQASFPKVVVQQHESVTPLKPKPVTRVTDLREQEALSTQPKFKSSESAYAMLGAQGNARGVNVEELFDIQQQADFFISLGQHDQAIEVLQNHIHENAQTSPLVYLDLLKLYHRQDRRVEYQDLTMEFTRLFNADVPAFEAFQDQTRGLEAYEATLSQITSFWHTDTVLKIIEDSVFREAGRTSEALDLEAYRELLLLHSIAKDLSVDHMLKSDANDPPAWPTIGLPSLAVRTNALSPGNFNQTIPQKLAPSINVGVSEVGYNDNRASTFQKPVGARIGLDIDLTVDAPDTVADTPVLKTEKIKPEDASQATNSGLIEFDLDAFSINEKSKSPLK